MKYKLVVTDMDGTFLDDASQISEKNMAAVRRLRELGIHFSPVTGRGTPGLLQLQPVLEQKELCITYNGCMVVDPVSGEIKYHLTLTEADARKVYAIAVEEGATIFIWSDNKAYGFCQDRAAELYAEKAGMPISIIDDVEPLMKQGITKFMLFDGNLEHAKKWQKAILAHKEEFESLNVVMSGVGYLDVINARSSKGSAVEELARSYGISREEVIAFGDASNDIPMLEYAGLGVAMANGAPEVLACADLVALSNQEDGVAAVLEEYVFRPLEAET